MELMLSTAITILVAIVIFKVAFYSLKKVIINLILGYATWWVLGYVFDITVPMTYIWWILTALFGPFMVLGVALWHMFM